MNRIDQLLQNYRRHVSLPARPHLAAAQRVWFAVYPPDDERRLQHSIEEFAIATRDAGLQWHLVDLHGEFAAWMQSVDADERAVWFNNPGDIELYARSEWRDRLVQRIKSEVAGLAKPADTVVAVAGLTELFDYMHVSELLEALPDAIPGFLLLFFPGEREHNTYRFLCARDGWDYLAVPIVSDH